MREPGGGESLAVRTVARVRVRDALDRHVASKLRVVGAPDDSEASRAEALEHAVAAEQQPAAGVICRRGPPRGAGRRLGPCARDRPRSGYRAGRSWAPVDERSWSLHRLRVRRCERLPCAVYPLDRGSSAKLHGSTRTPWSVQSYLGLSSCKELPLSFFDDEPPPTEVTQARTSPPPPRASRPRRPPAGDHHAIVVRRRVLAGVALLALIAIIVLIASVVGGGKREALETYGRNVSAIAKESNEDVSAPFFQALSGASGQQHGAVEQRINELRATAENQSANAKKLNVPSGMEAAQRYLLQVLGFRTEGLMKIGSLLPEALGGGSESATKYKQIAGAMQIFLASDVVYSQRVAPLIEEELSANGASGQSIAASRFLPNLGWLETATLTARIGGKASPSAGSAATPGTHGSALTGVSVHGTTLVPGELNHISSGSNPTFDVKVEDNGENSETNVKVNVTVTTAGKQYSAYNVIPKTTPGQTATVEVPIEGVPLNTGAKIEVYVEPVPGETDIENNKATYEATFS
jgi:hypothetical protein